MADLSKLSTEDLLALKAGDLTKVSTDGLQMLRGTSDIAQQIENDPISTGARDFAKDMPAGQQYAAGMGKAFTDIGRGGAQMVGAGPTAEETAEQRKLDAPLMDTGAGIAGNISGNVAALAPLALVPGANTVAGAAALGASTGALQPTKTAGERLTNMATGGAIGTGAQWLGTTGARMLGHRAAGKDAATAAAQSQNAVRDATLKEATEAGYVVPPSAVRPSFWNKRAESIAGKAAVGQEAAGRNQQATTALARKALGLADDAPITEGTLDALRNTAAEPYREIAALPTLPPGRTKGIGGYPLFGPDKQSAADALRDLKLARNQANAYWKEFDRMALVTSQEKAVEFGKKAQHLEKYIEDTALAAGRPDLVEQLKEARTLIAKSYDVERALNIGTGDVSAPIIGRAMDKGKPLTGELATIGKFAEAFPSYAREGARIQTPGVSRSEALASAVLGIGGFGAAGPVGMVAGALPLASGPVRSMVLSKPYQRSMATPKYAGKALNVSPEDMALMARALALPGAASYAGAQR